MKITVALDSLKGSLDSASAGMAVKEGILAVYPTADVRVFRLSDGGEGLVDALLSAQKGCKRQIQVTGPLGTPVLAEYGVLPDGSAVMEMAAAAGLTLVPPDRRDPRYTTTYGVGEMILDAVQNLGCRRIIMGIGGSATNDGGVGMLQALGVSLTDAEGRMVERGATGLARLQAIDTAEIPSVVRACRFTVACDVTNPLCGPMGCSAVYGPQKGADGEMIAQMDAALSHYADLTKNATGKDAKEASGAGAAGGLGFAFLSYLDAELRSGASLVTEALGLEAEIRDSDLVVTGEGRLDGQSTMGKAPVCVAQLAKKHGVPVVALAGCITPDAEGCHTAGIDAFFPILPSPCTLDAAMEPSNAYRNLQNTAKQVIRLALCMRSGRNGE